MKDSSLKEVFINVILNNLTDRDKEAYKLLAFDIVSGEREAMKNDIGNTFLVIESHYINARPEDVQKFCERNFINNVDYEATATLMKEQKTDYIRIPCESTIVGVNLYSTKPYICEHQFGGKKHIKRFASYKEMEDAVEKGINIIYLPIEDTTEKVQIEEATETVDTYLAK